MKQLPALFASHPGLALSGLPLGLGIFLIGASEQSFLGAGGGILFALLTTTLGTQATRNDHSNPKESRERTEAITGQGKGHGDGTAATSSP